jgi:beta-mannosidase
MTQNAEFPRSRPLDDGWEILHDVHGTGERLRIFDPAFRPTASNAVSMWERLDHLGHLQVVCSTWPFGGRELRSFNEGAWWYRVRFAVPDEWAATDGKVTLRFGGVDYTATAWLNGHELGSHEGYWQSFEFDVTEALEPAGNVLVVKVTSPWDDATYGDDAGRRTLGVVRGLLKGTYEHSDGLIQRDVNPIGIWGPVTLIKHGLISAPAAPAVRASVRPGGGGRVNLRWVLETGQDLAGYQLETSVVHERSGRVAARETAPLSAAAGRTTVDRELSLRSVDRWQPWDRGEPVLYTVSCRVVDPSGAVVLEGSGSAGFRDVELRRDPGAYTFLLDGEPYFLRGTSYFPDAYVSLMDRGRYRRDIEAAIRGGFNALRVHVHVERPEFYEECDRLGMLVIQDSDLNWIFPESEDFRSRAVAAVTEMVETLMGHPSIAGWICVNEGAILFEQARAGAQELAARIYEAVQRLDPTRPAIANSWDRSSPISGDEHVYDGSLTGGEYTDSAGQAWQLLTEFGVDAPSAAVARAGSPPALRRRVSRLAPRMAELHDYQYNLVKYYIQRARLQRFGPCAGYFQFMLIDLAPQSYYGLYDYWGIPKVEGGGGGLRALAEVNHPVAVLVSVEESETAIWVVNDLATPWGDCTLEYSLAADGTEPVSGLVTVAVGANSLVQAITWPASTEQRGGCLAVSLTGPDGRLLASNRCDSLGVPQPRPAGYPGEIDHEIGMRTWLAWGDDGRAI